MHNIHRNYACTACHTDLVDYRLFQYFAAVAHEGTVSAAAETLHITQPALSRQIKQLETKLGLQLFHRTGNRLTLTSEGRQFLTVAREVLLIHTHAEHIADTLAAGSLRNISIGAPSTTLIDIVAPFVATFTEADPVPHVSELNVGPELARRASDYDLIIVPQRPPGALEVLPLAALPVWAYVPSSHRWGRSESVELSSLCTEDLILVPPTLKSRQVLDATMHLSDVAPRGSVEVAHGRLAQALAAAGRGVAVLSDDAYFDLHPLQIIDHRGHTLRFQLYAAWRRDHHGNATLRDMAQRVRDFCQLRYGPALASDTEENMSP